MRRPRFLQACHRQPVDCRPVWLMRQAGRYLPAYRRLRERYDLLEMIKDPERAAEVTLQPLEQFDLDAAIVFADILTLLEAMGLPLQFVKGTGPVIDRPLRRPADLERLIDVDPRDGLGFTLEAIGLVRRALVDRVPVIGFSGAPFTLACYAIEGGPSRQYRHAKGLMFEQPALWHRLMERLADQVGRYLVAQVEAGAQVLQVFDSWVGALSPADYRDYVLPHTATVLRSARRTGRPVIHFGTHTATLLPLIRAAGAELIGVDWRVDLRTARRQLGPEVVLQGNLDPLVLLGPVEEIRRQAARILDEMAGDPAFLFNLGHGVLPETPPEHVAELVDFVHRYPADAPVSEACDAAAVPLA